MANQNWDFECPQYIDFEKELDSSGKDIFFESTFYEEEMRYTHSETKTTWRRYAGKKRHVVEIVKKESKDKSAENGSLCTPEVQGKGKGLTESDENRLLSKMTAALSLLENTPKLKKTASKGKLFPESVFKSSKTIKSSVKPKTLPSLHPRSRMSKSLDHLNKIISGKTNKRKKPELRKSSSLNDLRPHNKFKYPVTPMCLKRTIFKAKEKNARKTTEEMELEQIAKLQKQLKEHLRQNEISLKKLNLRSRQCAASRILPKADNLKYVKDASTFSKNSNAAEKEPRRNINLLSQSTLKKEALKLDNIINSEIVLNKKAENVVCPRKSRVHSDSAFKTDTSTHMQNHVAVRKETLKQDATVKQASLSRNTIYSKKTKTLSVSTAVQDVITDTTQKTRRPAHKILDHAGLVFIPSVKSNTTLKPSIFEQKHKETRLQTAGAKQKEISTLNLNENSDKENKGCIRPLFPGQRTQNAKWDINKLNEPHKVAGKRTALIGTPLAENVARN